ncbi:hypothetical protein V2W45_1342713 [Cenococcum geophilum]
MSDTTNIPSTYETQSEITAVLENSNPNSATGHAVAAFKNAIYLAAQCISKTEQQTWISSYLDPLQSLKRLTHLQPFVPEGVCLVAYWDRLENILGDYLFGGIEKS